MFRITVQEPHDEDRPVSTLPPGVQLVIPGDTVLAEPGCLKGKGLMLDPSGQLVSTICGTVERVNKLIYVRPLKYRYSGDVGDVVVGRIVEVQADRWMVDYGGTQLASLPLGGINLPGNEQRRRMDEDKLQMRDYFREGDLISCEVQKVMESGEVVLHMRSNRYSALQNGQLIKVPSCLVRRQQSHVLLLLDDSVQAVLGNNGWLWFGAPGKKTGHIQSINFTQVSNSYREVDIETRAKIVAVSNASLALGKNDMEISLEAIQAVLEAAGMRGRALSPEYEDVRTGMQKLLIVGE